MGAARGRLAGAALALVALACSSRGAGGADAAGVNGDASPGGSAGLEVSALSPAAVPSGEPRALTVRGRGFAPGDQVWLAGGPVPTAFVSAEELAAQAPPLPRGRHPVAVARAQASSAPLLLEVLNAAPTLSLAPSATVGEEEELSLPVGAGDPDGDAVRLAVSGLPPGARFDEERRVLSFRPTSIQGGGRWEVEVVADDGAATSRASLTIEVADTLAPPEPEVVRSESHDGYRLLTLRQTTDAFLDSPGHAGRTLEAWLVVPDEADASYPMPVQIELHGFSEKPAQIVKGSAREFRLYPHDPMSTYWWGYSSALPAAPPEDGRVEPYTARRVLHLLEYVLRRYPGADPERVWVAGGSMGGSGALTLGTLFARHFAFAQASAAQTVPRLHRPSRQDTLAGLWWAPDAGAEEGPWDRLDLTRALRAEPEAREQFLRTWHGKDDTTIHFGAMVGPSPLTGTSFLEALQAERLGHLASWDEGSHTSPDPVLGRWLESWNPIHDPRTFLRRDRAFPAFSLASHDRDPGDGGGNGRRDWDPNSWFAGRVAVAGDTGWNGELAGGRNRSLRWDATALVDEPDRFEIPLGVQDGPGGAAPRPGYPTTGDRLDGPLPVYVDVTPRRTQAFRCRPGERVLWSFGEASGEVAAGPDGAVTVPALPLTTTWTPLVLRRGERP